MGCCSEERTNIDCDNKFLRRVLCVFHVHALKTVTHSCDDGQKSEHMLVKNYNT